MHALTILRRCLGPPLSGIHARRPAQLLPASADPVIVGDSGFKVPFFREVERLGWLGRPGARARLPEAQTLEELQAPVREQVRTLVGNYFANANASNSRYQANSDHKRTFEAARANARSGKESFAWRQRIDRSRPRSAVEPLLIYAVKILYIPPRGKWAGNGCC
jgi:hypothetical protein